MPSIWNSTLDVCGSHLSTLRVPSQSCSTLCCQWIDNYWLTESVDNNDNVCSVGPSQFTSTLFADGEQHNNSVELKDRITFWQRSSGKANLNLRWPRINCTRIVDYSQQSSTGAKQSCCHLPVIILNRTSSRVYRLRPSSRRRSISPGTRTQRTATGDNSASGVLVEWFYGPCLVCRDGSSLWSAVIIYSMSVDRSCRSLRWMSFCGRPEHRSGVWYSLEELIWHTYEQCPSDAVII